MAGVTVSPVTFAGTSQLEWLTFFSITTTIAASTTLVGPAIGGDPAPIPPRIGAKRLSGGAIIEIRTVVGTSGASDTWTDVACQVVSARATWGNAKSNGILTQAEGGILDLEIYDPDRLLDPTNKSSPYYSVLAPGMWIRFYYYDGAVRTLIKWALVDTINHTITTAMGRITAHDWVSVFSNMPFPNQRAFSNLQYNTLHAFAAGILADAFTYAPLTIVQPVTVEAAPTPPISIYMVPLPPGLTPGQSAGQIWDQITRHAKATFYYSWIAPDNVMHFRSTLTASSGQIGLGTIGPLPLEFASQSDAGDVSNVIWVNYNGAAPVLTYFDDPSMFKFGEKSFTSPPIPAKPPGLYTANEYGAKVLADRKDPALNAIPLRIWPASSQELKQLIAVQGMDSVVMRFDTVSPVLTLFGLAIGAAISVDSDGWAVELFTWLQR